MVKTKPYVFILLLALLLPVLTFGQDKVLFNTGKEKKATVLYKDNTWIYFGMKPKKSVDETKLKEIESAYKIKREAAEKKYDALINDLKNKNEASKETDASVKKAAVLNLIKKKEVNALAHVQYKSLKRVRLEQVFSVIHADGHEEVIYSPDTLGFLVLDVVEPELDYSVEEMRRYIAGAQDGMRVKKGAAFWTSAGISVVGSGLGAFYGPIAPSIYIVVLAATRQKPNEALVSHPEYILDEAYLAGYRKAARKRKIIAAAEGGLAGLAVGLVTYQTVFRGWK